MQLTRNNSTGYWDLLIGDCTLCSTSTREWGEVMCEIIAERILKPAPQLPVSDCGAWEHGFTSATHAFQRGLVIEALKRTGGNKKEAARILGIERTTLQGICKRLEVEAMELMA